jgi:micrococcal nuclease
MRYRRRSRQPRFWPDHQRRRSRFFVALRPFVFAAILIAIWIGMDPSLVEPPSLLSTEPERVAQTFTRCGRGRGFACVVDGDTFRLGERRVRIIGIDAPETRNASCPEEARLGDQATIKLQTLLNAGAFEMVAPLYGQKDRYGRDLRVIRRTLLDGSTQSIADEMRESGFAHRYMGGFKAGWC